MRPRVWHDRVVDLMLEGWKYTDIATELGRSRVSVWRVMKQPRFQDELARRRGAMDRAMEEAASVATIEAKDIFARHALDAARTLTDLLDSPDPRVRQKAASEILTRAGIYGGTADGGRPGATPPAKVLVSEDQAKLLRTALAESGAARLGLPGPELA